MELILFIGFFSSERSDLFAVLKILVILNVRNIIVFFGALLELTLGDCLY